MATKDKKINVVYYSGGSYSAFVLNHFKKIKPTNFIIFGFDVFEQISFSSELNGDTKVFKELSLMSKEFGAFVIVACEVNFDDKICPVVLIFEQGKLVSICEQIFEKSKAGGNSVNFLDTEFGRLGFFILDNAAQIEFYQLGAAYESNLIFSFPKNSEAKTACLCADYASEKYKINTLCFLNKKIKSYCSQNKTSSNKLIFSSFSLKNKAATPSFLKQLHKSIYLKNS